MKGRVEEPNAAGDVMMVYVGDSCGYYDGYTIISLNSNMTVLLDSQVQEYINGVVLFALLYSMEHPLRR